MKIKRVGWTNTEAIYGISRDSHSAGVVYRCDCGCDKDLQAWVTKKKTYNISLLFCTITWTIFKCVNCKTWFIVGPAILWSFRLFKKKPMPDLPTPAFYKQLATKRAEKAKKNPTEETKIEVKHVSQTRPKNPCFNCGSMKNLKYVWLDIYAQPPNDKPDCYPGIVLVDAICPKCLNLLEKVKVKWIYCGPCESLKHKWIRLSEVKRWRKLDAFIGDGKTLTGKKYTWQKYWDKEPSWNRLEEASIYMVDHCEDCNDEL